MRTYARVLRPVGGRVFRIPLVLARDLVVGTMVPGYRAVETWRAFALVWTVEQNDMPIHDAVHVVWEDKDGTRFHNAFHPDHTFHLAAEVLTPVTHT